jgi:hypothetical protein
VARLNSLLAAIRYVGTLPKLEYREFFLSKFFQSPNNSGRFGFTCVPILLTMSWQTLNFGSTSHRIQNPQDSLPYDVYLTKPFESTRRALKLPNSSSLHTKPKKSQPPKSQTTTAADSSKSKPTTSSKSSTSSSLDSDIEALQNGFAAHNAARERLALFILPIWLLLTQPLELTWSKAFRRRRNLQEMPRASYYLGTWLRVPDRSRHHLP